MPPGTDAVLISNLTIRYGNVCAVDQLSLSVKTGEIFGFLGPNGAGKTSTLRALLDLLRPATGEIKILGENPKTGGAVLRRRLGFVPGDLALFGFLSAKETLEVFAGLHGGRAQRREEVLDALRFPMDALNRKVRGFSSGMRQMVGLCVAMQHDPELLVLDEPTTGLDPIVRSQLIEFLKKLRSEGNTVLFSSHVLSEVESCADRVALIQCGSLRLVESMESLMLRLPRSVRLVYEDGRREEWQHEGQPADLIESIQTDGLEDVEIRSADLGALFRMMDEEETETSA